MFEKEDSVLWRMMAIGVIECQENNTENVGICLQSSCSGGK